MSVADDPRAFLRALYDAAVDAAKPARTIAAHLPEPPKGRTIVVGAGKASAAMAAAFETAWEAAGRGPLEGLVVTRDGHGAPTRSIEIVEASHPRPDARGAEAAERILALADSLGPDDLLVALVSGGGSSLLTAAPEAVGLDAKRALSSALLASGASIREMNCVRKHVSRIKGGRLAAAAHPARVHTLVVSDIPGDDAALVASGPTLPDPTTRADALAVLARYDVEAPWTVREWLGQTAADAPRPEDPAFARDASAIIAAAEMSLRAAAEAARAAGVAAHILSDAIEGEARDAGAWHAAVARRIAGRGEPFARPCVLLSGGETVVTVRSSGGRGGRNAECALGFAIAADGLEGVAMLAGDTDGIDGTEDNAGAIADGTTVARLRALGREARDHLDRNDAYSAFEALGDLVTTGPTLTNVNDFRAVLIA